MTIDIDQILIEINKLSFPATLVYLAKIGIDNFIKPGYQKIAQAIKDKQNKKRYAFVPNKAEAIKLGEIGKTPTYNEIVYLIPNHKYLDIIRTGLLVSEYSRNLTQENDKRIGEIKIQILKIPSGKRLVKLINLTSTIFFSLILKYLYSLKRNNYPLEYIESEFEGLVDDWEKSSLLVKNEDDIDKVIIFCHSQSKDNSDRFFILAIKERAVKTVEDSVEQLSRDNFFKENFYSYQIFKEDPNEIKRIEVIVTRKDWVTKNNPSI
ncbi:MAG: hypothetical protein ABIH65_01675 [Nanoarchaeota archaeon]